MADVLRDLKSREAALSQRLDEYEKTVNKAISTPIDSSLEARLRDDINILRERPEITRKAALADDIEAVLRRLSELEQAARRVVELDGRERFGDETLTGLEWGEAIRALAALSGVGGQDEA